MKKQIASISPVLSAAILLFCLPQTVVADGAVANGVAAENSVVGKSSFIVPEPRKITFAVGQFPIDYRQTALHLPRGNYAKYSIEAQQIQSEYQKLSGGAPDLKNPKKLNIKLVSCPIN